MTDSLAGGPYALWPQKEIEVRIEAGHVVVTLGLVSLRDGKVLPEVRIALPEPPAGKLGFDLVQAATKLAAGQS